MIRIYLMITGLWVALLSGEVIFASEMIEVISVQNRQAQELSEIVKPLLTENESIQVAPGNQLILRSQADHLPKLMQLIKKLDVPSIDLMVSVSFGMQHQKRDSEVWRTKHRQQQQGIRTVRVQDGQFARIEENKIVPFQVAASGASLKRQFDQHKIERPLTDLAESSALLATSQEEIKQLNDNLIDKKKDFRFETDQAQKNILEGEIIALENELKEKAVEQAALAASVQQLSGHTKEETKRENFSYTEGQMIWDYQTLPSGLFVQPKVIGEQVQLIIVDKRASHDQPQQGVDTTYFESKMMMPYGEWVQIGSAASHQDAKKSAWHLSTRGDQREQLEIWVKVELAQ